MQQHWKHYWAALGFSVTAGGGWAMWMWQVNAAVTAAILGLVGLVVLLYGATEFQSHEFFWRWSQAARARLRWLLFAGIASHAGWVVWVQATATSDPGYWAQALAVLLAVSAGSAGVAHVAEYVQDRGARIAEIKAEERERIAAQDAEEHRKELAVPAGHGVSAGAPVGQEWQQLPENTRVGYRVLAASGLDHVSILSTEELHGGSTFTWDVQLPDAATLAALGTRKKGRADKLSTSEHGEPVAIAAARVLGEAIESDWVQIYKHKTAGQYRVTLTRWASMGEVHPYRPVPGGHSVTVPAQLGTRADGLRKALPVNKHLAIYAGSGSGKSAVLHLIIDYFVSSTDGLVMAIGMDKFYDLVAEWLEPFLNTGVKPPLVWTGFGPRDAGEVVAALLRIIDDRQNRRKSERTTLKTITLIMDEQKSLMDDPSAGAVYNGRWRSVSWMVARVHMKGNNASVKCVRAGQRSTNDHGGTGGADSNTNTAYFLAGWSQDPAEAGRVTGDYKLGNPDTGQWWIKAADEPAAELMKADYPQESGGDRVQLHNEQTISEIAWSRRVCDNELDEADAAAAGPQFAARFTEVTEDYLDYLRGRRPDLSNAGVDLTDEDEDDEGEDAQPSVVEGSTAGRAAAVKDPSPQGQAAAGTKSALRDFLAMVPSAAELHSEDEVDEPDEEECDESRFSLPEFAVAGGEPAAVTAGQQRSTRDRIVAVLQAAGGPLSAAEIHRQLGLDGGAQVADQTVRNLVSTMTRRDELARDEVGYVLPVSATG